MNGYIIGFHPLTQKLEPPCTTYSVNSTTGKYCSSFQLNGHTIGFRPQTQKLEPPCTA